jgi:hypothetical protein
VTENENNIAAEHAAPIADRVGRLVQRLLSPPYLGSMAAGSAAEDRVVDRWREELGRDAARLWSEAVGREPEATRIVELVQYRAGFVPGSALAIRSTPEIRERYRQQMRDIFA